MVQRDAGHLGTLLLEEGIVTEEVLKTGLDIHQETGRPLGRVLVEENLVEERDLVRVLAKNIGIEFVDLDEGAVDPAAAALIPEALARRYAALPIGFEDDKLVIAMADPNNIVAIDELEMIINRPLDIRVSTLTAIRAALKRSGSSGRVLHTVSEDFKLHIVKEQEEGEEEVLSLESIDKDGSPIIKLMHTTIFDAIQRLVR